MTALRQIPEDELRSSLRAAAVLRTTLDELATGARIRQGTRIGNLDRQREAVLEADDGSQYMVVELAEGPTREVELRVAEGTRDPAAAIDSFLDSLALSSEVVVWRVTDADWPPEREPQPGDDPPPATPSLPPESESRPLGGLHSQPAERPGHTVDVVALIDRLDDLVHDAKQVPFTDQVRVHKEQIRDIVDQLRTTIPDDLEHARRITEERKEIVAEAEREAKRIVEEAHAQQRRLVSEDDITTRAERLAEDIIEEARENDREMRLGAEDYADEILNTLEVNLSKFIASIRRGRDRLAGEDNSAEGPTGRHRPR